MVMYCIYVALWVAFGIDLSRLYNDVVCIILVCIWLIYKYNTTRLHIENGEFNDVMQQIRYYTSQSVY